jgi:menaquinone-dependent protoporphyrinogen oxidase
MDERHENAMRRYLEAQSSPALLRRPGNNSVAPPAVLVVWESKHGATADIGYAIGGVLREYGLRVDFAQPGKPPPEKAPDAYVIGSAIYAGHWMKQISRFVHENAAVLRMHPVWLFSSGPVGDPPLPAEAPVDAAELVDLSGARGHQIFAGKLDRKQLSFTERALTTALRAPEGDFRDWGAIKAWATGIAQELTAWQGTNGPVPSRAAGKMLEI